MENIASQKILKELKGLILNKATDRWLSISEVINYASVSDSTVRRAVKRGTLKASKSTGKLLFKISNVDAWLKG